MNFWNSHFKIIIKINKDLMSLLKITKNIIIEKRNKTKNIKYNDSQTCCKIKDTSFSWQKFYIVVNHYFSKHNQTKEIALDIFTL